MLWSPARGGLFPDPKSSTSKQKAYMTIARCQSGIIFALGLISLLFVIISVSCLLDFQVAWHSLTVSTRPGYPFTPLKMWIVASRPLTCPGQHISAAWLQICPGVHLPWETPAAPTRRTKPSVQGFSFFFLWWLLFLTACVCFQEISSWIM